MFYGENQSKAPVLSLESGIYQDEISLEMTAGMGAKIYYTLDGSEPTRESLLYDGMLELGDASVQDNRISARDDLSVMEYSIPSEPVDKAWCIKAKAFYSTSDEGSRTVTKNYLVKPLKELDAYETTDILFLTIKPEDLVDYEEGMMVRGAYFDGFLREEDMAAEEVLNNGYKDAYIKANYSNKVGRKFEKLADIQQIRDGKLLYMDNYVIRNRGVSSSDGPKKTYNLYYREEFSKELFDSDIFLCGKSLEKMVLRREDCILHDSLYESLYSGSEMLLPDGGVPIQVFINGEYWGLYSLEEKMDENWFSTHAKVSGDKVTVLKNGSVSIGNFQADEEMQEIIEYCDTHDMSLEENYEYFCDKVDIDSFLMYYASMFYLDACDFLEMYNTMQWRVEGEKWHWALYDLDNSASDPMQDTLNYELKWDKDNAISTHTMFASVMKNEDARCIFKSKVEECKKILSYNRVCDVLEPQRQQLVMAGKNDNQRWGFTCDWDAEITRIEEFFMERPNYVDDFVTNYLESF